VTPFSSPIRIFYRRLFFPAVGAAHSQIEYPRLVLSPRPCPHLRSIGLDLLQMPIGLPLAALERYENPWKTVRRMPKTFAHLGDFRISEVDLSPLQHLVPRPSAFYFTRPSTSSPVPACRSTLEAYGTPSLRLPRKQHGEPQWRAFPQLCSPVAHPSPPAFPVTQYRFTLWSMARTLSISRTISAESLRKLRFDEKMTSLPGRKLSVMLGILLSLR